jgi:hypothetical protein
MPLPINLLTLIIKIHQLDLNLLRTLNMLFKTYDRLFPFKGPCHLTLIQMANLIIAQLPSEESRGLMMMQMIKKEFSFLESNLR